MGQTLRNTTMGPTLPLTDLLSAWGQGDPAALNALVSELYDYLHARAHLSLKRERQGHFFDTTDLVHELYLKLREMQSIPPESTTHFVRLAARIIRNTLVDYARMLNAEMHGGHLTRVGLEVADLLPKEERTLDILIIDDVLAKLEAVDPRLLSLIELRFFLGMTEDEAAAALGMSRSGVQREWKLAKRLLASELRSGTRKEPDA